LNLYSTDQDEIDADAESIADLFAAHAAIALRKVREIEGLHRALESRELIGQATGIVMERYTIDADAAFAFLLRASSHGNLKLRDVAERLIADTHSTSPID
jgi:AmiR/NasT family two-component response regulator